MALRLREADSMASMAELRQKIAELEIQVGCLYTDLNLTSILNGCHCQVSLDFFWVVCVHWGDRLPCFFGVDCLVVYVRGRVCVHLIHLSLSDRRRRV